MNFALQDNRYPRDVRCAHCGDLCHDFTVYDEEKHFCCNGCRMVYRLLKKGDPLSGDAIYRPDQTQDHDRFSFLDQPEFKEKLIYFSDGTISRTILHLPAIHCSACIYLLENLPEIEPAIVAVRVNFLRREASIDFRTQKISLKEIARLLTAIGYEPDLHLSVYRQAPTEHTDKLLIIRLGIAGFCFGNMMLFAFPDYLAAGKLEPYFYTLFSWLNFLLSFPVMYSAGDYFRSALAALREKTVHMDVPVALGIATLFVRSAYEVITATGTGYFDSLAGLVFFLLIGKIFQKKTFLNLSYERDYRSYFPLAVIRLRRGNQQTNESIVALNEIEPGDRLRIRHSEIIPADAILMSPSATVDYSFITGESIPVQVTNGDRLMAGGKITGASAEIEVIRHVSQSYLTELWNQIRKPDEHRRYLSALSARIAKIFTVALLIIAGITALVWYFIDPSRMWFILSAVLIIACPCALALTLPFTYGTALRLFGRHHFYLKNTNLIETLAKVRHIVFDKTGTLTYARSGQIEYQGRSLDEREIRALHSLTAQSTHPLSRLIASRWAHLPLSPVSEFREEPTNGIEGVCEGLRLRVGRFTWVTGVSGEPEAETLSRIYVAIDDKTVGYFSIDHQWREGLDQLVAQLRASEITLSVLSGDSDKDHQDLRRFFGTKTDIRFRQSPFDKLRYIRSLRNQGLTVMMIGDGLNDAGALQEASVGVAITEKIGAFTPKSDAILDASALNRLPSFILLSRSSVRIVYLGFAISFLYNLIGIAFAALGWVTPLVSAVLMPISSISVVALSAGLVVLKARKRDRLK